MNFKKLLNFFVLSSLIFACNNGSETKTYVKNDSTILLAPGSNSNMTDLHGVFVDSSRVDSTHPKIDTPLAK